MACQQPYPDVSAAVVIGSDISLADRTPRQWRTRTGALTWLARLVRSHLDRAPLQRAARAVLTRPPRVHAADHDPYIPRPVSAAPEDPPTQPVGPLLVASPTVVPRLGRKEHRRTLSCSPSAMIPVRRRLRAQRPRRNFLRPGSWDAAARAPGSSAAASIWLLDYCTTTVTSGRSPPAARNMKRSRPV